MGAFFLEGFASPEGPGQARIETFFVSMYMFEHNQIGTTLQKLHTLDLETIFCRNFIMISWVIVQGDQKTFKQKSNSVVVI